MTIGEIRKELLHKEVKKACCARSELTAMLVLQPNIEEADRQDTDAFGRAAFLRKKFGIKEGGGELANGFFKLTENAGAISKIPECCKVAYIKGFFQIAGVLSKPDAKAIYLEIPFKYERVASFCKEICQSLEIRGNYSKRRNNFVFYVKNFDGISSLLTYMGLGGEALAFFVAKTDREVINEANRIKNCDMANIAKTIDKYESEVEKISKLKTTGKLQELPEKLRELCLLRLENPCATYGDLGKMCKETVSKSTISSRMKQIMDV